MNHADAHDRTFDGANAAEALAEFDEFENCVFATSDLSKADISGKRFIDCEFRGCNLSLVGVTKTGLRRVRFIGSKLLGVRFETCNPLGLSIAVVDSVLDHSSFFGTSLKKTVFRNTQLHEVDFTDCDLSGATFDNCDLERAIFRGTNLEKVDFLTAHSYTLNPAENRVKKARFSLSGLPGLLALYDIEIR
jgi:fluoroquinolone resistance protein